MPFHSWTVLTKENGTIRLSINRKVSSAKILWTVITDECFRLTVLISCDRFTKFNIFNSMSDEMLFTFSERDLKSYSENCGKTSSHFDCTMLLIHYILLLKFLTIFVFVDSEGPYVIHVVTHWVMKIFHPEMVEFYCGCTEFRMRCFIITLYVCTQK